MKKVILWFVVCVLLMFGSVTFAATDNLIIWTGQGGTNGLWSDLNNWDGADWVEGFVNIVEIDATGYDDPYINSTITTQPYDVIRVGYADTNEVGVTMTGGTLQTLDVNSYISFAYSTDTKATFDFSGGLIKTYSVLLPRLGYADCNMTGGTMELTGRIRMGEKIGHKGGVFNMSGGSISFPNSGDYIDYLGVGFESGDLMTFNMSGSSTINTKGFSVGRGGPGTFNMTGGTLNVTVRTRVGEAGGAGNFNMAGGNVDSNTFDIGYGTGPVAEVNMTGGTLDIDTLTVGRSSVGQCFIQGGTATVNHLTFIKANSFIDLTGAGQLIWADGNYDSNVVDYIAAGKITAYEGSGRVLHSYNSPDTVIEADDTARYPIPAHNAVNVDSKLLAAVEWQNPFPGETVYCDVFLGTDETMATATKIVDHQAVSSVGVIVHGGYDYYWRVDTYDPETSVKTTGVVWTFETPVACELTGADGDANGDCYVNFKDFAALSANWMECGWLPTSLCD